MAYQLATAYVAIVPSMKDVGKAITKSMGAAGDTAGTQAGQKAGEGFAKGLGVKGAIIGAASSITAKAMDVIGSSVGSAVERTDLMANFPKVMKNLGFSSEDAAKSVQKISKSLDGLPTASSAITGMVQQLAPLTPSLDEATNISLAFNNAMLAGGASVMEQENALAQYTQMLSAGKVDMQAWRSIQSAMPGQLNQMAEALLGAGKNGNDLYEAMKDGTVSFDDFNKALMDLNENGFGKYASFADQAKSATEGIGTAFENVKNRIGKAIQKVIEAIGVENISGAINNFSSQFGKIGQAAADIVTLVKGQLGEMKTYLDEMGVFDALGSAWNGLVAAITGIDWSAILPTAAWDGFRNTITSGIADMIAVLGDLIGWIAAGVQHAVSFAAAFAQTGAFDTFIDALGRVMDIGQLAWDTLKNVAAAVLDVTGLSGGAASFGQAAGNAFKTILDATKPLFNALERIIQWFGQNPGIIVGALGTIGTAFAAVKGYQALNNGLQTLTGTMEAVTSGAKNIKAGFDLIKESGGLFNTIKEFGGHLNIVSTAQAAWQAVTKAGTAIQAAFNAVLAANPIGLLVTAIAAAVAALTWFFTQTETGRQAWQAFTTWLGETWQAICDFCVTLFQGLVEFFTNLWNGIQTVGVTVWNAISTFFTTTWQGICTFFQNIWNSIGNFFTGAWNGLQANLSAGLNAANAAWTSIWNGIKGFFQNIWNGISGFFTGVWNALKNAISAGLNSIRNIWNSAWNGIKSFFQNIWNGLRNSASNGVNAVFNVVQSVKGKITGFFSNAGSWLANAGQQIMSGLANGIQAGIQWVRDRIASVANIIPNWLKNKLGIHSPSRVMRDQIGVMISRGLADGIVSGTKYVSAAARELEDAAVASARSNWTGGFTATGYGAAAADYEAAATTGSVHITNYYPQADPWPVKTANESDHSFYGA